MRRSAASAHHSLSDSSQIDPERLAALLDGRLDAAEAAAVRAELARADEDTLGAYADAAAIIGELGTPVVSIAARRARTRRWMLTGAAAAGIIAVSVLGYQRVSRDDAVTPDALVLAMAPEVRAPDSPAWGISRGGETSDARSRAIRLGALLVDLELSARNPDSSSALLAASVSRLLSDVPGATLVAREYADSTGSAERRRTLGRSAASAVGEVLATVGAMLEAARVASASGDSSYFRRQPFGATLDLASRHAARSASDSSAIASARDSTRSGSLPSISEASGSLLRLFSR